MDDLRELLDLTSGLAADFYDSLPERPVFPRVSDCRAARGVRRCRCRRGRPTHGS